MTSTHTFPYEFSKTSQSNCCRRVWCAVAISRHAQPLEPGKFMGCTHSGGGAQVWNSTTIMALSARLPWLTALVLPQRQLETPQRKRLSHSEPPWRERAFNSVYFWTEFVVVGMCAVMGILNLCTHMFDFTISLLLSQSGAAQVFSGWRVAGGNFEMWLSLK